LAVVSGAALVTESELVIIGGGLAGCEAAWQAARRGVRVTLHEMRPHRETPAHRTDRLAELVCSNSLGSDLPDRAGGLLKAELRRLGSLILEAADATAVPAGGALAVDRQAFSAAVTEALTAQPNLRVVHGEVTRVPELPTVVASGPLTSAALADDLVRICGAEQLHFYDAVSPIVALESVDPATAFRQSRYGRGTLDAGDYVNCPLDEAEFQAFVTALVGAQRIELRDFEREDMSFFEACLPIEVLAERSPRALRFGPLRPMGLRDPRTGRRPHAVVQLRQDDAAGALLNMVGFQTNLRWSEQRRVFRLIPGLEQARFERFGQMHRNTFLNAPRLLEPTMCFRRRPDLLFAGQITGIEGYAGNAASGLVAGVNAARLLRGLEPLAPPPTTMAGALCRYVARADGRSFQPMKANFGLLPPLDGAARGKAERNQAHVRRALTDLERFVSDTGWSLG